MMLASFTIGMQQLVVSPPHWCLLRGHRISAPDGEIWGESMRIHPSKPPKIEVFQCSIHPKGQSCCSCRCSEAHHQWKPWGGRVYCGTGFSYKWGKQLILLVYIGWNSCNVGSDPMPWLNFSEFIVASSKLLPASLVGSGFPRRSGSPILGFAGRRRISWSVRSAKVVVMQLSVKSWNTGLGSVPSIPLWGELGLWHSEPSAGRNMDFFVSIIHGTIFRTILHTTDTRSSNAETIWRIQTTRVSLFHLVNPRIFPPHGILFLGHAHQPCHWSCTGPSGEPRFVCGVAGCSSNKNAKNLWLMTHMTFNGQKESLFLHTHHFPVAFFWSEN